MSEYATTIDELIKALQSLRAQHGDLPIHGDDSEYGEHGEPGINVYVREAEPAWNRVIRLVIY